jgi:hypothetical protein
LLTAISLRPLIDQRLLRIGYFSWWSHDERP